MSSYCATCGTPLPIDSSADLCWRHGGPRLLPDSQIRCPFCKELILAEAKKCKHCGEFLQQSTPSSAPVPTFVPTSKQQQSYAYGSKYCTHCGHVGPPRGMDKLELILVLFISVFLLFIPLMIYLFVRSGERCRTCGKKALIPLGSPIAQTVMRNAGPAPGPSFRAGMNTVTHSTAAQLKTEGTNPARQRTTPLENRLGYGIGHEFGEVLGQAFRWIGRNPLWALALLIIIVTLIGIVSRTPELAGGKESEAIVKQRQRMEELAEANRRKDAETFKNLTAREHLSSARALLKLTSSKKDVEQALRHLDAITTVSAEFVSAQPLRKSAQGKLTKMQQQESERRFDEESKAHPQDIEARVACKDYVTHSLKAPATADFPFFGWNVVDLGKWNYRASSYVDSQNSFGANIRTTFTCDIKCVAQNNCVVVSFNSSP